MPEQNESPRVPVEWGPHLWIYHVTESIGEPDPVQRFGLKQTEAPEAAQTFSAVHVYGCDKEPTGSLTFKLIYPGGIRKPVWRAPLEALWRVSVPLEPVILIRENVKWCLEVEAAIPCSVAISGMRRRPVI